MPVVKKLPLPSCLSFSVWRFPSPTVAHADTNSAQRKAQKDAEKSWHKYMKQQKKSKKSQEKAMKNWNKHHQTGRR